MVVTISPTHSTSSSHTGTLPARGKGKEVRRQRDVTALRTEDFKKGADGYKQAARSAGGKFLLQLVEGWYRPPPGLTPRRQQMQLATTVHSHREQGSFMEPKELWATTLLR